MATAVEVETVLETPYVLILHVTAIGDETAAEQSLIDVSAKTGPDGLTLARTSLMEASWNINSKFENAKLYWHDEANDEVILSMSGDNTFNGNGIGGLTSPDEVAQAGDQDVLIDFTNAAEATGGSADIMLVFKKKSN